MTDKEQQQQIPDMNDERNWVEDYDHENGRYLNPCQTCGKNFMGHKRRITCKMCNAPAPTPAGTEAEGEDVPLKLPVYYSPDEDAMIYDADHHPVADLDSLSDGLGDDDSHAGIIEYHEYRNRVGEYIANCINLAASLPAREWVSKGVELIAAERERQVSVEGWTPEHDAEHTDGQMAMAAACYATPKQLYEKIVKPGTDQEPYVLFSDPWPWDEEWDKRMRATHNRIRRLQIAGALIAAEIDRITASESPAPYGGNKQ
jgi:hypothetical protein